MADEVRVGVIGVGSMGRHHARNYSGMEGVRLVALADPSPEVMKVAGDFEATHYVRYQEMLEREHLDAVSVAVPTQLHLAVALTALDAGIHVLVEKPIARTEDEGDILIDAARRSGTILTVGHIERFNPAVKSLRAVIDAGDLGEVSSLVSRRVGGWPQYQPPTDVVLDLAIHDIDVMSFLLRRTPSLLAAHGSRTFHDNDVDSAEILLEYGAAGGFVQANWVTPLKIRTLAATGSRGYAEINYITQEVTVYNHVAVSQQENFTEFVAAFGTPEKTIHQRPLVEPLHLELHAFIEAVRSGNVDELMRPEEALAALETALEASRALQSVPSGPIRQAQSGDPGPGESEGR